MFFQHIPISVDARLQQLYELAIFIMQRVFMILYSYNFKLSHDLFIVKEQLQILALYNKRFSDIQYHNCSLCPY
ncbi:hypothetical protein D3C78_614190 [compost metagenome]